MTTFGDVRAALHGDDDDLLLEALGAYDDPMMPILEVLRYVGAPRLACVSRWMGLSKYCRNAIHACGVHTADSLKLIIGCFHHSWDNPEPIIQRAMIPMACAATHAPGLWFGLCDLANHIDSGMGWDDINHRINTTLISEAIQ